MTAQTKLVQAETRLFVRDPIALFFGLAFPAVLLLMLGLFFPGFDEPSPDLDGARYIDVYAPVVLVLGLATLGLVTLPPILGTYRQFGILRRLSTTPMPPARLLSAQLIIHLGVAVLAAIAATLVAIAAFDVPVPELPIWFVASFLLGAASIFSLGLTVGAVARSSSAGQAIGMAIYFPMLFFAGVWVPRTMMSDTLLTVSDLTPLGSAVQALDDAWFGMTPEPMNLLVMTVWTVVATTIAIRTFRWE